MKWIEPRTGQTGSHKPANRSRLFSFTDTSAQRQTTTTNR
nr:MAG TPA: Putative collagen-binding domain of a collagenase [Caudoviricetes sp.]DAX67161.1 MAG TPA: Putative collagen-binding domain of a collagenase [Caudoviricetes sp.]